MYILFLSYKIIFKISPVQMLQIKIVMKRKYNYYFIVINKLFSRDI